MKVILHMTRKINLAKTASISASSAAAFFFHPSPRETLFYE
jgi:hypothetical protein